MSNKEAFLKLVSNETSPAVQQARERIKNRAMLRESQQIALKVLVRLDELGWSKKQLAEAMDVTPQQISKIVSGKENLTIGTQIKLQELLDIPILATYFEDRISYLNTQIFEAEQRLEQINIQKSKTETNYSPAILAYEVMDTDIYSFKPAV